VVQEEVQIFDSLLGLSELQGVSHISADPSQEVEIKPDYSGLPKYMPRQSPRLS
jgi:hypothetical protein